MAIVKTSLTALEEAADFKRWFSLQQPGLGQKFQAAFAKTRKSIANNPLAFREAYPGFRAALIRPFKVVAYFIMEGEDVIIIALVHSGQAPESHQRRLGQSI